MVNSLNKKIIVGYLWNLAAKWITRTIGVISSLILIRLLTPADFGIATLANIVMALFVMLSQVGTDKYVIKAAHCSDALLNSAWSLNIALKIGCGVLIALVSAPVAQFIHEPVLRPVLLVCSLIPIIGSLKNIGILQFERELNYQPLTRLAVFVKCVTFPITIGLAIWLRNYWALMIGSLMSEILTVMGSYWIHSYRPHWSTTQWRDQWHFSKWMLISTTTGYLRSRLDAFLLGRFLPSDAVGMYRVSQEFAWLPFSELIAPATRSFYAGISTLTNNRAALNQKLIQYQLLAYVLVIPSAFGLYALQDQIVPVVMGPQWAAAAPVFGWLSLLMLSMPLNIALQSVLTSLSKVKYLVWLDGVMIAAIAVCFSVLYEQHCQRLATYTQVRVMLVVVFILMLLLTYQRVLKVPMTPLLMALLLPMIPGGIMLVGLKVMIPLLHLSLWENLVIGVISGGLVFTSLMILLVMGVRRRFSEYQFLYDLLHQGVGLIRHKLAVK